MPLLSTLLTAAPSPTPSPTPVAEQVASGAWDVLRPVLAVALGVVVALVVSSVVGALVRRAGRGSRLTADLSRRAHAPLRVVLVVVASWVAVRVAADPSTWRRAVEHGLLVALIGAIAWLVGSLAFVLEDQAVERYRTDVPDNRHARRVRTQVQVLRRLTVAVLAVCAVAAMLLTFPGARALGASVLASAGLISIVAGLAAQSSLANVFAGMQLAFTDAIRVDDVVVVEGEWGRIEEITLTYVVVHVWDDRRLIMPSTYFTTTAFENWTRRDAHLLGTVELDVDWRVPVPQMRAELTRLLESTEMWDRRVGVLQVTDAVNGVVRVRALASAADAPTLFDLRCHVREGLVAWVRDVAPQTAPRTRWTSADDEPAPVVAASPGTPSPGTATVATPASGPASATISEPTSTAAEPAPPTDATAVITAAPGDARLFTGSFDAIERSRDFQGPGQDAIDEREEHADRS
ncbi:mechanosensitive ion channel family protein [Cellulomonas sp. HZM]|uniref:mechanosensitive ion channel family protein n=1 Tax=Cellulomonas sp. HZM TaxID=1454010 RepID=UPI0009DFEA97|nr:mechanosensitive ion channel domain-containing protein [Cellulomonas sp. HZM]